MAKIVICEDEVLIQKLIFHIMRSTSHEIFIASNGSEGFALIERERPDLIVTDISMPGMDGHQLAHAVKTHPDLASIPIVFLTAFAQQEDVKECFQYGAVGYLSKPFNAIDLRVIIDEALTANKGDSDAKKQPAEH